MYIGKYEAWLIKISIEATIDELKEEHKVEHDIDRKRSLEKEIEEYMGILGKVTEKALS